MENNTCKICFNTKSITNFHKNKSMKSGYENVCKQCRKLGRVIVRKPPMLKVERDWVIEFKLNCPTKKDYQLMYQFLTNIGYDISKDIHKQFCDKYDLSYKNRSQISQSHYLFDGEKNPLARAEKLKK